MYRDFRISGIQRWDATVVAVEPKRLFQSCSVHFRSREAGAELELLANFINRNMDYKILPLDDEATSTEPPNERTLGLGRIPLASWQAEQKSESQ